MVIVIMVFVCLSLSANASFNRNIENTDTVAKSDSVCKHMYKCFVDDIQYNVNDIIEESEVKLYLEKANHQIYPRMDVGLIPIKRKKQ